MISNIQQQNFDGVVNKIVFNHETSSLCINNNNTNKNQNITATIQATTPSEWILHNQKNHHISNEANCGGGGDRQTGKGYEIIIPFSNTTTIATNKNHHSSENAKEFVLTTAKTTTIRTKLNDTSHHQNNNNQHHHHKSSHHLQNDQEVNGGEGGNCTSLLDEITELIENHPNGTESAFNNNNNNNNAKNKTKQICNDSDHNNVMKITPSRTAKNKTVSATATVVFKNANMDHQYSHPHQHHHHNNNKKKSSSIRHQRYQQTADHRNAFRFIEDVHNYSKLNRSDDSTNSSSQDDEEDFEEDVIEDHRVDNSNDDDDEDNNRSENKESKNCGSIENDVIYIRSKIMEKEEEYKEQYASTEGENAIITSRSQFMHGLPDDDEEKITPEHHARRPMNAFLIFCKRHRAIVKEKYKNLENRSITKILGEWWASLNAEEKTSYTNLAKQYKDAFFSANPNFKWYKLPAPPLRTLSTRPSNTIERPVHHNQNNIYGITSTNCNETIVFSSNNISDNNICKERSNRNAAIAANALFQYDQQQQDESDEETQDASEMRVFKLADEAQMGGISSLIENSTHNMNCKNSGIINHPISNIPNQQNVKQKENIVKLQSYYNLPTCKDEPFENMKGLAAQIGNNNNLTINGKRKSTDDYNPNGCKKPLIQWFTDSNVSSGEEDVLGKKSERSCKGKKYQELMNSGQIITFTKKTKPKSEAYSNTMLLSTIHNGYVQQQQRQQQQLQHSINNNCIMESSTAGDKVKSTFPEDCYFTTIVEEDINNTNNNNNKSTIPTTPLNGGGCAHENYTKQFDASDFDLEKKIKALPAQSLEEYLTRKRETKKKKKINSKRHKTQHSNSTKESPKTIQEAKERIQSQMVGSQKRKARKESITRRDINSMIIVGGDAENKSQILSPVDLWNTNIVIKTEGDEQEMVHAVENANNINDSNNIIIINNNPITTETKTETTTTSDLLILAEVAANHIEDNV